MTGQTMIDEHYLTYIFSPKDFSTDELLTILPKFKKVTFSRNDYLLKEGRTENQYWFIETGFIRSFVTDTDGNDITLNFFAAGEIVIDWTSFFVRMPTRENIQALTDCTCWQLEYDDFQELFHGVPKFREQGRSRFANSYFALKTQRVSMIVDQAKERYRQLVQDKPYLIQNVSLKHIATYLGITDTSLSRIRKEIANE